MKCLKYHAYEQQKCNSRTHLSTNNTQLVHPRFACLEPQKYDYANTLLVTLFVFVLDPYDLGIVRKRIKLTWNVCYVPLSFFNLPFRWRESSLLNQWSPKITSGIVSKFSHASILVSSKFTSQISQHLEDERHKRILLMNCIKEYRHSIFSESLVLGGWSITTISI